MNRSRILHSMFYDMQKQTHKTFFSEDAAAVVSPGIPVWLYPKKDFGEDTFRLFFCSLIAEMKIESIIAPKNAALICAEVMTAVYGGECREKEMIAYYLNDETRGGFSRSVKVDGFLCPVEPKDAELVIGWLKLFYAEVFNTELPSGKTLTNDKLNGHMPPPPVNPSGLFVWWNERPVAMGMLYDGDITARLNLIYTPREYRRRGYGAAVVNALSELAVKSGRTPMLYTYADNIAANALYQSLGFKEAGRLTEILLHRG